MTEKGVLHLIEADIDPKLCDAWIKLGLYELGEYLAKHAEFARRYPVVDSA